MEVGKILYEFRDVSAGSVDLDGDGDGVAVVFDNEDDGQLRIRGGVQGLPEFALRCRALADGDIDDLVALEGDVTPGAVVAFVFLGCFGMIREVASGLGAADGVEALAGCRG